MAFGNYFNNMNQPNMYGFNPYQQQPMQQNQIQQPIQPIQPIQQNPQPTFNSTNILQGKSVDSIDVVKAMDIPLDGSVSFFPLTDGTAIVTKQLQKDGTSKTIIYKPIVETPEKENESKYITIDEFNETIKQMSNNNNYKEEIKEMKRQIKNILEDIREIENRKD